MAFTFFCQRCGSELEGEDEWVGLETVCPACSAAVVVPGEMPPAEVSRDELPVLARCPVCGKPRGYARARIGRDVECRDCGALFALAEEGSAECRSCHARVRDTLTRCPSCGESMPSRFDVEELEQREREVEAELRRRGDMAAMHATATEAMANEVRCPRCGSSQVGIGRRGFSGAAGLIGALCVGPLGLLAGCAGSGATEITCLVCSFRWSPSSLAFWVAKIVAARKGR